MRDRDRRRPTPPKPTNEGGHGLSVRSTCRLSLLLCPQNHADSRRWSPLLQRRPCGHARLRVAQCCRLDGCRHEAGGDRRCCGLRLRQVHLHAPHDLHLRRRVQAPRHWARDQHARLRHDHCHLPGRLPQVGPNRPQVEPGVARWHHRAPRRLPEVGQDGRGRHQPQVR